MRRTPQPFDSSGIPKNYSSPARWLHNFFETPSKPNDYTDHPVSMSDPGLNIHRIQFDPVNILWINRE